MITYSLNFDNYNQHLIQVGISFTANTDSVRLSLPTWIPGSYLIREFSRNITKVHAKCNDTPINCEKTSKNSWLVSNLQVGKQVTISYEVYAYDLSVRTAYVDQFRLYGNFTSIALAVQELEDQPIAVEFSIPQEFVTHNNPLQLACTLPIEQGEQALTYVWKADNYLDLIDHPFEIAKQDSFTFPVTNPSNQQTINHQFYIAGTHSAQLERLYTDVQKICQSYLDWLGDAPFDKYLFMTLATANDFGGLEHHNSTSLITPRDDLPKHNEPTEPNKNYRRYLGLCSHEYFHAWWVKFIRPTVYLKPNLSQEVYTPLLWVFEGFTSYFDDLMLFRSGVINEQSYLELLTDQINRYYQTPGRSLQTVAESSFDSWIKLYRHDENTANAGISYYNKGALVALCLDLILKRHGHRLSDVVKALYERAQDGDRGVTDSVFDDIFSDLMGEENWYDFRSNYIDGTTELPIGLLLDENGVDLSIANHVNPLGLTTKKHAKGVEIMRASRTGNGAKAGLSAKDIIIAVNNLQATPELLMQAVQADSAVTVHFFRRDELHTATIENFGDTIQKTKLEITEPEFADDWLQF